eukprot:TRINITY_DN6551_c0_g1_i10.p5 TRINITY_DN6551_c0_g1~~TRINITY_DN6551_c0_g1_i10.p5  ORF type:complete len:171 (+),score=2.09 TRINITY_DN6551_c0_g1_i10:1322-1834(+)
MAMLPNKLFYTIFLIQKSNEARKVCLFKFCFRIGKNGNPSLALTKTYKHTETISSKKYYQYANIHRLFLTYAKINLSNKNTQQAQQQQFCANTGLKRNFIKFDKTNLPQKQLTPNNNLISDYRQAVLQVGQRAASTISQKSQTNNKCTLRAVISATSKITVVHTKMCTSF